HGLRSAVLYLCRPLVIAKGERHNTRKTSADSHDSRQDTLHRVRLPAPARIYAKEFRRPFQGNLGAYDQTIDICAINSSVIQRALERYGSVAVGVERLLPCTYRVIVGPVVRMPDTR